MRLVLLHTAIFLVACESSLAKEDFSSTESSLNEVNLYDEKTYLECTSKQNKPTVYVELSEKDRKGFIYLKNVDFNALNHSSFIGLDVTSWSEGNILLEGLTYEAGQKKIAKIMATGWKRIGWDYNWDDYKWKPTYKDYVKWRINRVSGTITSEAKFFYPASLRNYSAVCNLLPSNIGYERIKQNKAALEAYREQRKKAEEAQKAKNDEIIKSTRKF